ncbi:alpha/beta hydrolase [Paludisphaera mucosa]|uniref:Alpha/beta hydrolase n=1 Tax=Paludisphaera mucosa TaxID=3030827 RepID=A0ABT6F8B8_9BACT|nr:alpha/beta hydrolase [Paludisphaera mucosa]MDG3003828.1 alpha/beta hydrolase [Paludisphaera mucosa]
MLRPFCWLVVAAATFAAWNASSGPSTDPFAGLVVVRDLTYRTVDGRSLKLDLILPDRSSLIDRPVLIAVHGGSWTGGSKRDYGPQFASLARAGIAVAVVDYRLARPGAPSWDGALGDVLAALDWLHDHGDEYHLDRRRVAAVGTSSGGLLAALAAQEDPRIAAAVCLSTPYSLLDLAVDRRLPHEPTAAFLGGEPSRMESPARAASPIERAAAGGPALLLIHGSDDAWVSVNQARKMQKRLEEVGGVHQLIEISGARHGFELDVGSPVPRDLNPDVRRFLDEAWRGRVQGH